MKLFNKICGQIRNAALASLVLAGVAIPANASWVASGYSGFKDNLPGNGNVIDPLQSPNPPLYNVGNAVVNFAAYQYVGAGSWSGAIGLPSGSAVNYLASTSAVSGPTYVYMYEVSDVGLASLNTFTVQFGGKVTSMGYIAGAVFNDAQGMVGSPLANSRYGFTQNLFLGAGTKIPGYTGTNPDNTSSGGVSDAGKPVFSAADPSGIPKETVSYSGFVGAANPVTPFYGAFGMAAYTGAGNVNSLTQASGSTLGKAVFDTNGLSPQGANNNKAFSALLFITSTAKPTNYDAIVQAGKLNGIGVRNTSLSYKGVLAPTAAVPCAGHVGPVVHGGSRCTRPRLETA